MDSHIDGLTLDRIDSQIDDLIELDEFLDFVDDLVEERAAYDREQKMKRLSVENALQQSKGSFVAFPWCPKPPTLLFFMGFLTPCFMLALALTSTDDGRLIIVPRRP